MFGVDTYDLKLTALHSLHLILRKKVDEELVANAKREKAAARKPVAERQAVDQEIEAAEIRPQQPSSNSRSAVSMLSNRTCKRPTKVEIDDTELEPPRTPTPLPVSTASAPVGPSSPALSGGPLDRRPVEIHLELLESMFCRTARFEHGLGPRFGYWQGPFISWLTEYDPSSTLEDDLEELGRQQIAYAQLDQQTRCEWVCRDMPRDIRNYLLASPDAWRAWKQHGESIIRNAMREIALQERLGPPTAVSNRLEEWPIDALLEKGRSQMDSELPLQWLSWLTPAGSDLLFLQNLQYNMEIERAAQAGRTIIREGICPDHCVHRLAPHTRVRAIQYSIVEDMNRSYDYWDIDPLTAQWVDLCAAMCRPVLDDVHCAVERNARLLRKGSIEKFPLAWLEIFIIATERLRERGNAHLV
ncbi:hypothetical protein FN846DRAFT_895659 [Sphaerosporella brunnea]|uniref:Uncharacterized protein n=1 Tax=Sphaerosporella brunnea TaxID=1250544 RepID=A0A5J5EDT8_9PEZI|nr:hypothetical protein FN846DRAFT_895659 [Sphaerosporella brunnea]